MLVKIVYTQRLRVTEVREVKSHEEVVALEQDIKDNFLDYDVKTKHTIVIEEVDESELFSTKVD